MYSDIKDFFKNQSYVYISTNITIDELRDSIQRYEDSDRILSIEHVYDDYPIILKHMKHYKYPVN